MSALLVDQVAGLHALKDCSPLVSGEAHSLGECACVESGHGVSCVVDHHTMQGLGLVSQALIINAYQFILNKQLNLSGDRCVEVESLRSLGMTRFLLRPLLRISHA